MPDDDRRHAPHHDRIPPELGLPTLLADALRAAARRRDVTALQLIRTILAEWAIREIRG